MPSDNPQKSRTLMRIAKYEVKSHIATGGMGAVYKAYDVELGRTVAIKVLSPELATRPNMLERFRREARSAAKLCHENIVALYDCDEANGVHYLAMEYVEGVDLHKRISRKKRLKPEEARQILMQAARALDHAFSQGIVHRDIKPSNFLLTKKDGKLLVKLADMGLARFINEEEARVTNPGTTVGTVDYISPEQARNSAAADIRSDIYSLGCTYYHMLAGHAPFAEGSIPERLLLHLEAEPQDICKLNPDVPQKVSRILKKMLAKKPEDRYQTPLELLADLENPEKMTEAASQENRISALAALAMEEGGEEFDEDGHPKKKRTSISKSAKTQVKKRLIIEDEEELEPDEADSISNRYDDDDDRRRHDDFAEDEDVAPSARTGLALPPWWRKAVVGVGVFLLVPVTFHFFLNPDKKQVAAPAELTGEKSPEWKAPEWNNPFAKLPGVVKEEKPETKEEPPPVKETPVKEEPPPVFQGPEIPRLPALFVSAKPLNQTALLKTFLGPFAQAPVSLAKAKVFRIGRGLPPGPSTFPSLNQALTSIPDNAILEIHDNGPILEPALPPLSNRNVVLRAGAGYRPMLAWDVDAKNNVFLTLERGSLTLENLDVVVKWPDQAGENPPTLYRLQGGDFACEGCTFSLAGKPAAGMILAQVSGPLSNAADAAAPSKLAFRQSYLRGNALVALQIRAAADVLFDGCLVVGGDPALVQVAGREEDSVTLRLLRSTFVCGQNLLRSQPAMGKDGARLQCLALDAILARSNFLADNGDLLHVADGSSPTQVSWRPVNVLYAGWINLLRSTDKTIPSAALPAWREQWNFKEGDRVLEDTWPRDHPRVPAEVPPAFFYAYDTLAGFAATSGPAPLGCVIGRLPPAPAGWLNRTYDWAVPPLVELPEIDLPAIPVAADKLYHGEKLDLGKVDLGQYLSAKLESMKLGPRVVLHLAGSGEIPTSPFRLKGVKELVLCALPPKAKSEPLTLVPRVFADRLALFDLENGNLELVNIRIKEENRRSALTPQYLLRIKNGRLVLYRCQLQGPLGLAPKLYKGLIRFENAGKQAEHQTLVMRDSVLVSGKKLVDLVGSGIVWRAHGSVLLAIDDGVHLDLGPNSASPARVFCLLEKNTLGFRNQWLTVTGAGGPESVLVETVANYVLDPFSDSERKGCLLRMPASLLSAGVLRWQGKDNAVQRLNAFVDLGSDIPQCKTLKDWTSLWGSQSLTNTLLVEATAKSDFAVDTPQLERLAFPANLVPGNQAPGADLNRLGLLKKKKG